MNDLAVTSAVLNIIAYFVCCYFWDTGMYTVCDIIVTSLSLMSFSLVFLLTSFHTIAVVCLLASAMPKLTKSETSIRVSLFVLS